MSKCTVKSRYSAAIVKITSFVPVFHLFTVCGAVTLVTPNTATAVTVGEQVLFRINHQAGSQYDVTFCSTTPRTTIATWAINNSIEAKTMHSLYEDRLHWNVSGSVVLCHAQINDSGIYEIEISYYSTDLKSSDKERFELRVFEPVSQPALKIRYDCPTPNITLSCSVSKGTNVTFHWRIESSGAIVGAYNRTDLVIDLGNEQVQHVYRCIAENPVSNATSDPVMPEPCNGNNGASIWIILLSLIPGSLFVWYSIISKKSGGATQEHNEQSITFPDGFIDPTYTTLLYQRETV
ncbi:hepatic and glial cell adhesion molecule-like [Heterodontus francisci]|uniref:hepatic and glial cell adhesion molecule-like n=1 Tax=Heterodontus francisci TaxID=7792 RepID=UPI00355C70E0